jgi:hypothetical protein
MASHLITDPQNRTEGGNVRRVKAMSSDGARSSPTATGPEQRRRPHVCRALRGWVPSYYMSWLLVWCSRHQ